MRNNVGTFGNYRPFVREICWDPREEDELPENRSLVCQSSYLRLLFNTQLKMQLGKPCLRDLRISDAGGCSYMSFLRHEMSVCMVVAKWLISDVSPLP